MIDLEKLKEEYDVIAAWGAGSVFSSFDGSLSIDYIVDTDTDKWGSRLCGIDVYPPDKLKSIGKDQKCAIIITTVYLYEVINEIQSRELKVDYYDAVSLYPQPFKFYEQFRYRTAYAEDAIVKGLCDTWDIEINRYIDIGSNHPVYGNATYLFYSNGARGYLIEPNTNYKEVIKSLRPGDEILNIGISSDLFDGTFAKYYWFDGLDTRNTFDKENAEYTKNKYHKEYFEKDIAVRSLNSLMTNDIDEEIDYINIDVEGLEWEILEKFEFDRFRIKVFNIEKGDERVRSLIEDKGYIVSAETPSNWIFVLKDYMKL